MRDEIIRVSDFLYGIVIIPERTSAVLAMIFVKEI